MAALGPHLLRFYWQVNHVGGTFALSRLRASGRDLIRSREVESPIVLDEQRHCHQSCPQPRGDRREMPPWSDALAASAPSIPPFT